MEEHGEVFQEIHQAVKNFVETHKKIEKTDRRASPSYDTTTRIASIAYFYFTKYTKKHDADHNAHILAPEKLRYENIKSHKKSRHSSINPDSLEAQMERMQVMFFRSLMEQIGSIIRTQFDENKPIDYTKVSPALYQSRAKIAAMISGIGTGAFAFPIVKDALYGQMFDTIAATPLVASASFLDLVSVGLSVASGVGVAGVIHKQKKHIIDMYMSMNEGKETKDKKTTITQAIGETFKNHKVTSAAAVVAICASIPYIWPQGAQRYVQWYDAAIVNEQVRASIGNEIGRTKFVDSAGRVLKLSATVGNVVNKVLQNEEQGRNASGTQGQGSTYDALHAITSGTEMKQRDFSGVDEKRLRKGKTIEDMNKFHQGLSKMVASAPTEIKGVSVTDAVDQATSTERLELQACLVDMQRMRERFDITAHPKAQLATLQKRLKECTDFIGLATQKAKTAVDKYNMSIQQIDAASGAFFRKASSSQITFELPKSAMAQDLTRMIDVDKLSKLSEKSLEQIGDIGVYGAWFVLLLAFSFSFSDLRLARGLKKYKDKKGHIGGKENKREEIEAVHELFRSTREFNESIIKFFLDILSSEFAQTFGHQRTSKQEIEQLLKKVVKIMGAEELQRMEELMVKAVDKGDLKHRKIIENLVAKLNQDRATIIERLFEEEAFHTLSNRLLRKQRSSSVL